MGRFRLTPPHGPGRSCLAHAGVKLVLVVVLAGSVRAWFMREAMRNERLAVREESSVKPIAVISHWCSPGQPGRWNRWQESARQRMRHPQLISSDACAMAWPTV